MTFSVRHSYVGSIDFPGILLSGIDTVLTFKSSAGGVVGADGIPGMRGATKVIRQDLCTDLNVKAGVIEQFSL